MIIATLEFLATDANDQSNFHDREIQIISVFFWFDLTSKLKVDHHLDMRLFLYQTWHMRSAPSRGADGADLVRGARRVSDPFDKYIFLYLSFELL